MKHFENLWEEAELLYTNDASSVSSIVEELILKAHLYKSIDDSPMSLEEKNKTKSHLFGEILLNLTQLSAKENINSYKALNTAIFYKK